MSLTLAQILQDYVQDDFSGELLRRIAAAYPLAMLEDQKVVKLKPKAVEKLVAKLSTDLREICDDEGLIAVVAIALVRSQVANSVVAFVQQTASVKGREPLLRQSIIFQLVAVLGESAAFDALLAEVLMDVAAGSNLVETKYKMPALAKCAVTVSQAATGLLENILNGELSPELRASLVVLLEDLVTVGSTVRALQPNLDGKTTTEEICRHLGLI